MKTSFDLNHRQDVYIGEIRRRIIYDGKKMPDTISLLKEFPSGFEPSSGERRKILECSWGETYTGNAGRAFVRNSEGSGLSSIYKKKHSASTSSHTGEFQPRALTGHSDLASAQSATPKLSVIEGDGPVGILNGHSAGTNDLVFKKK